MPRRTSTLWWAGLALLVGCVPTLDGPACRSNDDCDDPPGVCRFGVCVARTADAALDRGVTGDGAIDQAVADRGPADMRVVDVGLGDVAPPDAGLDSGGGDQEVPDLSVALDAAPDAGDLGARDAMVPDLAVDLAVPDACVAADERCNNEDEDCDGRIDEDVPLGDVCRAGVGGCERAGHEACVAGRWECDAEAGQAIAEVCTGEGQAPVDEDCDGQLDEGCACAPGATQACGVDVGLCVAGFQRCDGDGQWAACDGVGPVEELCNAADDDCDGPVDEGVPGVGVGCEVGEGACWRQGQMRCDADGDLSCDARPGAPNPEICNGLDDDCDGGADEGLGSGAACQTGRPGRCADGVPQCVGGAPACVPVWTAQRVDPCGGGDQDCDGRVDEDALPVNCQSNIPGCPDGQQICQDGELSACVPVPLGVEDRDCDGADDDCDGQVDEDVGSACVAGLGACAVPGAWVCAGGQAVCQPTENPPLPTEERCSPADEDCDGRTDEGPLDRLCPAEPGDFAHWDRCQNNRCLAACDPGFHDDDPRLPGCERGYAPALIEAIEARETGDFDAAWGTLPGGGTGVGIAWTGRGQFWMNLGDTFLALGDVDGMGYRRPHLMVQDGTWVAAAVGPVDGAGDLGPLTIGIVAGRAGSEVVRSWRPLGDTLVLDARLVRTAAGLRCVVAAQDNGAQLRYGHFPVGGNLVNELGVDLGLRAAVTWYPAGVVPVGPFDVQTINDQILLLGRSHQGNAVSDWLLNLSTGQSVVELGVPGIAASPRLLPVRDGVSLDFAYLDANARVYRGRIRAGANPAVVQAPLRLVWNDAQGASRVELARSPRGPVLISDPQIAGNPRCRFTFLAPANLAVLGENTDQPDEGCQVAVPAVHLFGEPGDPPLGFVSWTGNGHRLFGGVMP